MTNTTSTKGVAQNEIMNALCLCALKRALPIPRGPARLPVPETAEHRGSSLRHHLGSTRQVWCEKNPAQSQQKQAQSKGRAKCAPGHTQEHQPGALGAVICLFKSPSSSGPFSASRFSPTSTISRLLSQVFDACRESLLGLVSSFLLVSRKLTSLLICF